MNKIETYIAADFETTVYDGQERTDAWACSYVKFYEENVIIKGNINDFMSALLHEKGNLIIYFHNLKFDGAFIMSYLLNSTKWSEASRNRFTDDFEWIEDKYCVSYQYKYLISDMGQWYTITLWHNKRKIEFRDSMKLLPFSLELVCEKFDVPHKKLKMKYKGERFPNCQITPTEKEYIRNDVLGLKECLEIAFEKGLSRLTIGSCCMAEYKELFIEDFKVYFPDLTEIEVPFLVDGQKINVDRYIRSSYHGGWCYVNKYHQRKIVENGVVADVNSLYPSVMHSTSGNPYPFGKPIFFQKEIPNIIKNKDCFFYFVRIKTRFYLKDGMLPCIQIKGSLLYKGTEWLETSDVYDKKTGKYYKEIIDIDGNIVQTKVILTLTQTDYELIKEHYNLEEEEILDGCYFDARKGLFDDYINKWSKIKIESDKNPVMRTIAKLMQNNLYGKFAASDISSFKASYLKDDGINGYYPVTRFDKTPGYIPVGSAVTSYARNFTIRVAQQNYHKDKPGFVYADTDSIHCNCTKGELIGVNVHPTKYLHWKIENSFDRAFFTRQKTYIEHCIEKDEKPCTPYYNLKCAGMGKRCKDLFIQSITGDRYKESEEIDPYTEEELEFLQTKRDITDLNVGLKVPSKLTPKNIPGGILLVNTTFEIR